MRYVLGWSLVAATIAAAVLVARAGNGEDDPVVSDPVCGMSFPESKSAFKETYQGEIYHFCSQNCHANFMDMKDKYTNVQCKVHDAEYLLSYFTQPVKIYSKEEPNGTRIVFQLEKSKTPTATPEKVEATFKVKARVNGKDTQLPDESVAFQKAKEDGYYYSWKKFLYPGRLTLQFKVTWSDGKADEGEFQLDILPGEEFDTGNEYDGQRLTMVTQHETMHKIGKYWIKVGQALAVGGEGPEAAKAPLALVKKYQKYIDGMVPHPPYDDADSTKEFVALRPGFEAALTELEKVVAEGDLEKSREEWKKVDALQCTNCHIKFRWNVFSDLKRYPVVGEKK